MLVADAAGCRSCCHCRCCNPCRILHGSKPYPRSLTINLVPACHAQDQSDGCDPFGDFGVADRFSVVGGFRVIERFGVFDGFGVVRRFRVIDGFGVVRRFPAIDRFGAFRHRSCRRPSMAPQLPPPFLPLFD
ncbi:hypothetical protein K7G19_17685 [Cupriavidus sp. DB3]|uniref:hypothetical protein n=1 Tax=Cupriavidus sp. DB3 TaxID=2873259 RepID=UPI001CF32520|nr:hypothetical protein [Cupriavidus sp. DB3]MCA7085425.1 hypothetical protein [Cupriavidus sp. DB3]